MKYLVCSGVEFKADPSINDILTIKSEVGGNVGNLLFIQAVTESLYKTGEEVFTATVYQSVFSDEEIDKINNEYDAFILPLADAFRDDNILQLKNYAKTISKLRIPCVVIGVGLRAEYDADINIPRNFDEAAKEFICAVLEKSSCVGLRGEVTGLYLKRLGFTEGRDYMVIGCPSMCMAALGKGIKINEVNNLERICINGNDLSPENVKKMICKMINDYPDHYIVQQRISEIADVFLEKFSYYRKTESRVPGSLYGHDLYEKLLREKRVKCFANIYRWTEFLTGMDFCLNSRFHGNVVSLMAGTPSVIIPIDSRMQELCEYHQLPSIPAKDIVADISIERLLSAINVHAPETVAMENLDRYFLFLEKNGLQHVSKNYQPSYRTNMNNGNMEWKIPEPAFAEIDDFARVKRVIRYYFGRMMVKMGSSMKRTNI